MYLGISYQSSGREEEMGASRVRRTMKEPDAAQAGSKEMKSGENGLSRARYRTSELTAR
jgi:hypothetical protein